MWNHLRFNHRFLISTQHPVNHLGRDILCDQNVGVLMFPDKVELTFPDGSMQTCATVRNTSTQVLLGASRDHEPDETNTTVWWGLIPDCKGCKNMPLWSTLSSWEPWIDSLRHYEMTVEGLHCMMNSDLTDSENMIRSGLNCIDIVRKLEKTQLLKWGHFYSS